MKRRRFYWIGVFLLMSLLALTSCEDNPSGGGEDNTDNSSDRDVASLELTFTDPISLEEVTNLNNYLGKKDTVQVTAKALDDQGTGVSNVNVEFNILQGPGVIVAKSGQDTVTNNQGDLSAYYIVTLTNLDPTDVVIKAQVGAAGVETTKPLTLSTRDIFITIDAYPDSQRVPEGDSASTQLLVRVRDNTGNLVPGIPVRVAMLEGNPDAVMSPINMTNAQGQATTDLIMDPLVQNETMRIRAFVNVSTTKATDGKRFQGLRTRASRWAELDKAGGSVALSGAGKGGDKEIMASVTADTITVKMLPVAVNIESVYMWVEPEMLVVSSGENDSAKVYAAVFDSAGNGIPGLTLDWTIRDSAGTSNRGTIGNKQPTNANGVASATVYTLMKQGTWLISCTVGGQTHEVKLRVKRTVGTHGDITLSLPPSEQTIFADNGVSRAHITITVTDRDEVGVQNGEVRLSCASQYGFLAPSVARTDSAGTVTVQLIDRGLPIPQLWVKARFDSLNLIDSIAVEILETPPVDEDAFVLQAREGLHHQVAEMDSIEFRAYVVNETGAPYTEGTLVRFQTANETGATWHSNSDSLDQEGFAYAYLHPGLQAGDEQLRAWIEGPDGDPIYTPWITVHILPKGPYDFINARVYNEDGSEIVTLQAEPAIVSAVVVDTFGNPVADGHGITLNCYRYADGVQVPVGTVTPQVTTHSQEDTAGHVEQGLIEGEFSPGTSSGNAWMLFSAGLTVRDSINFTIRSSTPNSLRLQTDQYELSASGTGGDETCNITATVSDANGHPVEDGTMVFFLMDNFPDMNGQQGFQRPMINRSDGTEPGNPYGAPFDSAVTSSGRAQVSVSSGQGLGILRLQAWTFADPQAREDTVRATFSQLRVVAGPPSSVDLDINNDGVDGGGSIWNVEVAARITDELNNPVRDSIAVQFITAAWDPDSTNPATIGFHSFTGNPDQDDVTTPGVAHTIMSYHSAQTNRYVNITVQVMPDQAEVLEATFQHILLPIQEPNGGLDADPQNYYYADNIGNSVHEMYAYVYDGHLHWVNNQEVLYATTRGSYYKSQTPNPMMRENRAITGPREYNSPVPDNDDDGYAMRYLIIPFVEAFPDPRILETTATAEVFIVGYPETSVEPVTITLTHPPA